MFDIPLIKDPTIETKVFLGGTCRGFDWRQLIIPKLSIPYFNPKVADGEWSDDLFQVELEERSQLCSHMLYVITPASKGFYAIAELTEDSIKRPQQTLVCFLMETPDGAFDEDQKRSIEKTIQMLKTYHNNIYDNLDDVVKALNYL